VVFTGTYEHTIDGKNRLAIPSNIRSRVLRGAAEGEPVVWYVTLGQGENLCLYTQDGFEQRAAELDHSERDADEVLEYEQVLFTLAQDVEMDKAGRVRLPESLLARVGLDKDVVLLGVKDHLEIHDREQWNQYIDGVLERKPELLRNPRQLMKKKPG